MSEIDSVIEILQRRLIRLQTILSLLGEEKMESLHEKETAEYAPSDKTYAMSEESRRKMSEAAKKRWAKKKKLLKAS